MHYRMNPIKLLIFSLFPFKNKSFQFSVQKFPDFAILSVALPTKVNLLRGYMYIKPKRLVSSYLLGTFNVL